MSVDNSISNSSADVDRTLHAPAEAPRESSTNRAAASTGTATDVYDPLTDPLGTQTRPGAQRFGKYEVLGELGEGGMGRVYKAVDTELGRVVAVKVLRSSDPFEASRFRGEAEMIAALDHPNIIKVFDIATPPGERPYIVLEFCEGSSLDRELGGTPQEPRRAAEMMETLARAIQFAHEKGIIHRDLKPANILRARDKTLKLTDFGLAKELEVSSGMTPSNAVMGTPSYMSPEQAEGKIKELGPPADVYGLGAILYEMLTGRPPFRGVNMVDTLEQVRWAEPAPPSRLVPRIHRDIATICLKCLQKAPARRYQTAKELADDLRRWLNGETIAARPAPSWERLIRQVKRRPWQAAAFVATSLLLILLVFGWVFMERKNAQAKVRDEQAAAEKKLREEQEEADRKFRVAQQAGEKRLQKQTLRALEALNKIRALVLEGDLSRQPGLDPLYSALSGYYDELLAQDDLGLDKVELADGLVKVGDLFGRTGQRDQARAAYANAADRCRPLAATDPKARAVLATALLRSGQTAVDVNDYKAAEAACDEIEKRLAGDAPPPSGPVTNPVAAAQLAESYRIRGVVHNRGNNDFAKSEESYRRAVAIHARLVAELVPAELPPSGEPRRRALAALTDLGRAHGHLATTLLDAGKVIEAEDAGWRSHEFRQRVAGAFKTADKSGDALDARLQVSRSWGNLAVVHTRARALGTARYFAGQSLEVIEALVALDASNVEYRYELGNRLVQMAELDITIWLRPGMSMDAARRAEIAANLHKAKDMFPTDPSGAERRSRREQGLHATAQVLLGVLLADTEPRKARDEIVDSFKILTPLNDPTQGPVDPLHRYYRAMGRAMIYELNPDKTPERLKERLTELRAVVESRGMKRKHPDDIEQFRAFRVFANEPEFKELISGLRAADANPAPKGM